jgi:hypothetical protein
MSMFDELMAEFDKAHQRRADPVLRTMLYGVDYYGDRDPTCPRCDGGGEVTWNPSPINDPQCVETATCPRCEGTGLVDFERDRSRAA